ncbi:pseudouridylate synthase 4 [Leucogyrophana mollusca]|uniref:Pseudouridylate synthase 4 n=1 Tax=Leucogyrophana mollusca TaxID=85980 RepID=A0ACB8BB42_9AGAM|nr:pseudouridylate synthase 4 [Leucogyrophana mollusca]
MPKVSLPQLPLSGLFAVAKPSGPTSMSVVNDIKQLVGSSRLFVEAEKLEEQKGKGKIPKRGRRARETVKIGQGGTLDPLADGVLVVGIGKGTKRLNEFLDCVKEYRTTALLGCETDSYDGEGVRVRVAPWRHVTREAVEGMLDKFRGEIQQTPPIFSALKMDGRPLYEYARKGIPLPRPIEPRKVTVHSLEIVDWKGSDHGFRWPEKEFTAEEKKAMEKALESVEENPVVKDEPESQPTDVPPAAFVLSMKVSGGTYVRSIVHDLGHALGSAAHVVTLTRSRQGRFALEPTEDDDKGCVPWDVFSKAGESEGEVDAEGWTEWEREVLDRLEIVDGAKPQAAV